MSESQFRFIPDKKALFVSVQYFGESEPRYSINILKKSCTCKGWSMRRNCKHLKKMQEIIDTGNKLLGDNLKWK